MSKRGSRNNRRCPNNNSNTTTTSRHGVFTDSNSSLKQTTLSMYSKKHTKRKQPTPTTTKVCLGNDGFNRNNINNLNETITTTASSSLLNNNFKNNATGDTMDINVGVKLTDVDFSASSLASLNEVVNNSSDDDDDDIWRLGQFETGADVVCHYDRGDCSTNNNINAAFRNTSKNLFHQCNNSSNRSSSTFGQVLQLASSCSCSSLPSASHCFQTNVKRSNFLHKPSSLRLCPPPNVGSLKFRDGVVPLPKISWANENEVWNLMCWKDTVYYRNPHYMQQHCSLQPKMRAILIDWLSEVCEVYKLHRETFHLAVDFVDRYLSKEKNVPKANLQLIGITALFVAAKLEEIYPPKCTDFAYVTDTACSVEEISAMELCMLKTLNWALAPITAVHWLTVYLQIIDQHETPVSFNRRRLPRDFAFARFHRYHFIHLAQLIDLCMLDMGSLQFSYSVLAACAFAHILEPEYLALHVSGFKFEDIAMCYQWMTPFAKATQEKGEIQIKHFVDVPDDDMHNIQSHVVDLELLERSQVIQRELLKTSRMSPVFLQDSSNILPTPPPSDERPPMHVSRFPPFLLQP